MRGEANEDEMVRQAEERAEKGNAGEGAKGQRSGEGKRKDGQRQVKSRAMALFDGTHSMVNAVDSAVECCWPCRKRWSA